MKPLTEFNHRNQETKLSLMLHEIHDNIHKEVKEWFNNVFDGKSIKNDKILERNLKMNLDYLFSEAIWFIEFCEKNGYNVEDNKRDLQFWYDVYTSSPTGYKQLLLDTPKYYDIRLNRMISERTYQKRKAKQNAYMREILNEILLERDENN